jgi:hypothetical protein
LLTFFAAAKKVSAAPHRGEANRPVRKQEEANPVRAQPKKAACKAKQAALRSKAPAEIIRRKPKNETQTECHDRWQVKETNGEHDQQNRNAKHP